MTNVTLGNFSGDEFETNARNVLRDDTQRITRLLELRQRALEDVNGFRTRLLNRDDSAPSAHELNDTYNRFMILAAELLGGESFQKIFGVPPFVAVDLVDPDKYASSTGR